MAKVTYYATPEDMLQRTGGSTMVDEWVEVEIIGALNQTGFNDRQVYLVQTLDGAKRFTTLADHLFRKTNEETAQNE